MTLQVCGTASAHQLSRVIVVQAKEARKIAALPWYVTADAIERGLRLTNVGDQLNYKVCYLNILIIVNNICV